MDPKYIKPTIDIAKEYGPKAVKFIKDNPKEFMAALAAAKMIKTKYDERKKKKIDDGNVPLRKIRFDEFNKNILKNLNEYNREELSNYRLEIKVFIEQINNEMIKEAKAKKPLHVKRVKKWDSIRIQIVDKISSKDYQEYLRIYNNPQYKSDYFVGFEGHVSKFQQKVDEVKIEEVHDFIAENTKISKTEIERDFI